MSIEPEATIFWTLTFGLSFTFMFIFLKIFITELITCLTCATDFVPVHTRFPDEKTRTADFGFFILKTSPGNCSGLYSVLASLLANFIRETGFPREAVAIIFWTFNFSSGISLYK